MRRFGNARRNNKIDKLAQDGFKRFLIPPPAPSDDDMSRWREEFDEVAKVTETAKLALEDPGISGSVPEVLQIVDLYNGLKRRITQEFGGQVVTNAWLKIYEIIIQMDLIPKMNTDKGGVRAFFNAELPGAFTCAVNQFMKTFRKNVSYAWVASSYYPPDSLDVSADSKDRDVLGDKYGLFEYNRANWIMDPPSDRTLDKKDQGDSKSDRKFVNNGDVTKVENLVDLEKRARALLGGGATLYTSDAGIDVSDDYGRQEQKTSLIHLGQVTLGLMVLDKGGDMVVKHFTFNTDFSIALIASVSRCFTSLFETKPETSKPANSEVYLVGKGYLGIGDKLRGQLLDQIHYCGERRVLPTDVEIPKIPMPNAETDAAFLSALLSCARQLFARQQKAALEEVVKFAKTFRGRLSDLRRALGGLSRSSQDSWLANNPVILLQKSDRLPMREEKKDAPGAHGGEATQACPEKIYIDPEYTDVERVAVEAVAKGLAEGSRMPPMWYVPGDSNNKSPVEYRADDSSVLQAFPKASFRLALHVGQRKLFIGELRTLSELLKKWDQKVTIVYAGAAPGIHIPALHTLFPGTTFHLYDPAKFRIKPTKNIVLHNEYFTDDIAKQWSGAKCDVFISDIRVGTEEKSEEQVSEDMAAQERWTQIISPTLGASLKFRPPYGKGKFEYLKGRVMMQAWSQSDKSMPRSTESRLIVTPLRAEGKMSWPRCEYDFGEYENYMYYLNAILREWAYYGHSVPARGVDHCYDCAHEMIAWKQYLSKRFGMPEIHGSKIGGMMDWLTDQLKRPLWSKDHPHAHEPSVKMCIKRQGLRETFGKLAGMEGAPKNA